MMSIKSIDLNRSEWGPDKGRLTGKICIMGKLGEMSIVIDPDKAQEIITILADALIATTQETAAMMRSQIIEQASGALLEHAN